ncbi:MAG: lytic murein transglycosylase B [Betaproteobacteria bacterium]|jgi:membrane-bound lytic murein transglycosylase B
MKITSLHPHLPPRPDRPIYGPIYRLIYKPLHRTFHRPLLRPLLGPLRMRLLCALLCAGWSLALPVAQAQTQAQGGPEARAQKNTPPARKKAQAARTAAHKPAAAAAEAYGRREDVMRFATEVAARHGLDLGVLEQQLAQARKLPSVQRLIMPPPAGTAKNWAAYRDRFVEPQRIQAGLAFWRAHERWLEAAEARWGVPASLVVGIIGVETFYGRHMGSFRTLDALATLAFDFPSGRRDRSEFFRSELEQLLLLAHREKVEPASYTGSYAGALGLPQFMPGSLNRWAVDFDEDGHIDLHRNPADAIGSVAHYLAAFGWVRDMPTHYAVAAPVDVSDRAHLLGPDILPSFTPAQFAQRGAELPEAARQHEGLLALVELQNGDAAPSFVAGTSNFYAVTRYNWSSYYAMAVIELGQAVRKVYRGAQ